MPRPGSTQRRGAVLRRRLFCLLLLGLTVPLGLLWRLGPLHLPAFAFKYGGSALWAIAVYWTVALALPRLRVPAIGVVAGIIAFAVEFGKRLWWLPLDHFRQTLAGRLLLGRVFTFGAIAAYWLAIALVSFLDARLGCKMKHPTALRDP